LSVAPGFAVKGRFVLITATGAGYGDVQSDALLCLLPSCRPMPRPKPRWQSASARLRSGLCSTTTFAGGKHSVAEVVAKAQAILSEAELLQVMFDVGYFPPKMPSPKDESSTCRPALARHPTFHHGLIWQSAQPAAMLAPRLCLILYPRLLVLPVVEL
jgi:hypothetical protein